MIRNKRTREILAKNEIRCQNPLALAMGLRFSSRRAAVLCLPESRRAALDMLFVFFPIDVLFLDDKKKVVEIKRGLRPWKGFRPGSVWRYAIEIPVYRGLNTRIGDILEF